jgi:hypothetical protein
MRLKRDHQSNGLECLSAVVTLCRREAVGASPAHTVRCHIELESELVRLQTSLKQQERECAGGLETIRHLRKIRCELEHRLILASREPLPAIYHTGLPEIPIEPHGKDAGEWHLAARTLQTHAIAYKRALESKSEELAAMKAAYQSLTTLLSARSTGSAQEEAAAPAAGSSTEAP